MPNDRSTADLIRRDDLRSCGDVGPTFIWPSDATLIANARPVELVEDAHDDADHADWQAGLEIELQRREHFR